MSDSDTSARSASSAVLRYGLAVASVAAALIATLLLGPDALVTPIFFLAIILTAWIAGFGPGLVAALLATLVIPYFFLPPVYSVRFDVHELPHLIVFFISALLISWWSVVRRRAETSLRRARDEMDAKVQDRTADLSRSNEQLQAEIAERKRAEEVLQVQTVELRNHAQLLELAHDAILVRDLASKIIFWNRGAERMYGWTRAEARGEVTHTFLQTKFPRSLEETEAELSDDGYWEGEIVHTTRDGSRLVVASRQVLQRDQSGNPVAILEINNDITDRKRAEESVREQASLLNLTHDTIFVRGINDAITYWNRGAEELYGWKKEEAIGRISHQLLQTIFPKPLEDINEELLDRGRWQGEITHTKRDGTQVVVASRWSLKRDEQSRPVAVLETNNDITSRKLGEEKLRRSESYLAEAQRLSHTGSVGWSVLSGEIFWSEETYQIFEYDQTTKPTFELVMQRVHPDDRAFVQQTMDGAFEGTNVDIEHRLLMPDDALKHLHVLAHASRDSSGNLEVVGAVMDITATKQAEEAQRRSEEQWRDVFENNPTMYFMVDAGGKVLAVNPFGAQQLGYTVNDLIGQPVLSVFDESDRETVQTNLAVCLQQLGRATSWEARKVRRDGKVLWVRETAKAVPRVDGPIVLIACEDMTEKKRAEEALRKAQEELAHVTRVMTMGELVASIAHEVNQPLGAIVTSGHACVRLLSREVPDIDKSLETIGRMIKDGMRASEVIKRIRAILHKTPTEKAPLNINETIQEVIALVSSDVLRSKVEMRAELAPDLPPVAGDRIQLQQVILNLILNGKDAMSGVKTNPRELLITSRKSKAGELVVAVRDSGHGLDPADAERIFDPFFTTKAEGMGLGLSISRNIIEAHGGALWATPNEDRGATIQFTLPPSGT